jgi:hypothetical protein
MSDHTGPSTDEAGETGDSAADRSPPDGGDAEGDEAAASGSAADAETSAPADEGGPNEPADDAETSAPADEGGSNEPADDAETSAQTDGADDVPRDVRKYERFTKMDGARYERVNEFLRDRTYITAREWAIARLCADFRTETGVEMTKIGENLPELVPFMTDTYTPQAVNQARYSFEEKVTKAGATFLYGAMSGFFTAEDLDEMMYEVTEVAKFLLEVEGVDLAVADELEAEDKISEVMREVRASSADLRGEEVRCPECGHVHEPTEE